jgi:NTP pyrophosphatase (non-canonical NTP hydrolase)
MTNAYNPMQLDVEMFMISCGQEVNNKPALVDDTTRDLRISLMEEELLGDGELVDSMKNGDMVGIADGLADLLYVVFGTASAYGINMQAVFDEVQRSNMSKIPEDGILLRREDGKILKPATFSPADLAPVMIDLGYVFTSPEGEIID